MKCEVWSVECGVEGAKCEMECDVKCGVWSVEFGSVEWGVLSVKCQV